MAVTAACGGSSAWSVHMKKACALWRQWEGGAANADTPELDAAYAEASAATGAHSASQSNEGYHLKSAIEIVRYAVQGQLGESFDQVQAARAQASDECAIR